MVMIYGVKRINRIGAALFRQLLHTLPIEKQKLINFKIHKEDKELVLISQILLRFTLLHDFKIKHEYMKISIGKYGKPFLKDVSKLHFNLSHSGDWAFLAVSDKGIGIDVEKEMEIDIDIARKYFSPVEYEYLNDIKNDKINNIFFEIWTLKESYVKALGVGLNKSLNSFSIMYHGNGYKIIDSDQGNKHNHWKFNHLKVDEKYHVSACFHNNMFLDSIKLIESRDLVNNYLYENVK